MRNYRAYGNDSAIAFYSHALKGKLCAAYCAVKINFHQTMHFFSGQLPRSSRMRNTGIIYEYVHTTKSLRPIKEGFYIFLQGEVRTKNLRLYVVFFTKRF